MARPRVSFSSTNIFKRIDSCKTVAAAHGWHPNNIIAFEKETTSCSWTNAAKTRCSAGSSKL